MDTKRKLFFAVISMILLSATALAVPVADHKSKIPHVVTNIKTPEAAFFIIPSSTTPLTIKFKIRVPDHLLLVLGILAIKYFNS